MKALSVRAPWWWFILHGGKDIENRDWPTKFRGTIYLHASKWWRGMEVECDIDAGIDIVGKRLLDSAGNDIPHPEADLRIAAGCIVGKVDIVGCVRESDSPWFFGEFGFVLANSVAFANPIPFKGARGFFEVPGNVHVCDPQSFTGDTERRCAICQKLM